MRSLLRSRKQFDYASVAWHESELFKPARFAIRRPSLAQRIDLTARVRQLALRDEFLQAGDTSDQLAASLSELLVRKLYVEWGLVKTEGITINGKPPTIKALIEHGPESLLDEIAEAVKGELGLTENERKNF